MADEYIKRKDVVSALWKALYSYEDKAEKQFKEDPNLETGEWFDHRIFVQVCHAECLEEVLAIPSADVQSVVHGKWVNPPKRKENVGFRNGFGIYYECSRCGFIEDYHTNFCPDCGARMDGE